ncbi:MAG: acyl-CoA dehydrogenase family protein [Burkholderiaceae bacterium]
MSGDQNLVLDAAERVFADLADPQTILKAGGKDWKTPLWNTLDEMGLPRAWLPETLGGHGLSMPEGFGLARAAGRFALAVPLVETMIAGWIAGRAGLALPDGPSTLIVADGPAATVRLDDQGRVRARARRVPFAREATSIVVVTGDGAGAGSAGARVAVMPIEGSRIDAGENLAGDASDAVAIDADARQWVETPGLSVDRALFVAASCRSLQIAGALQAVLQMSVAYAMERVAFEKPIAKFQAVQQNLARLAGEVAAAVAASESAADALADDGTPADELLLEVASAKLRCGEAAETGAGIAHQVLGAIGFTEEHVLHRFTLRALSWRDDFGTEMAWARRLGEMVGRRDSVDLWRLLSAR